MIYVLGHSISVKRLVCAHPVRRSPLTRTLAAKRYRHSNHQVAPTLEIHPRMKIASNCDTIRVAETGAAVRLHPQTPVDRDLEYVGGNSVGTMGLCREPRRASRLRDIVPRQTAQRLHASPHAPCHPAIRGRQMDRGRHTRPAYPHGIGGVPRSCALMFSECGVDQGITNDPPPDVTGSRLFTSSYSDPGHSPSLAHQQPTLPQNQLLAENFQDSD